MWKAAFTGRSETGSSVGRSSLPSTNKKTGSTTSRRSEDDKRKAEKSSRSSAYGDESVYATPPSSRIDEPKGLTESAVRTLDEEDEDWEDDDKDARSERRSVRSDGRKHRRRSEKERSRSRSRDREGKRKSSSRKSHDVDNGDERAIPDMGSFQQFPGQYSHGVMGTGGQQEPLMSGALPTAPDTQFGQSRADSYGAAADYYLDEGQSIHHQPGFRAKSPNMLVNPDLDHLMMASATENPAQDTGHGSAADFYGGRVSPMLTEEPQSMSYSSIPGRPSKPGKSSSFGTAAAATVAGAAAVGAASAAGSYYTAQSQSSSSYNAQQATNGVAGRQNSKKNRQNTDPSSSGPGGGVYYATPPQQLQGGAASSYYNAQSEVSTSYDQQQTTSSSSSRPNFKPNGQTTDPAASGPGGGVYYAPPPQGSTSYSGMPGKQTSSQSNSHAGLYAAGGAAAIGAAGLAAYELNQHHQQHRPSMQSNVSPANVGMQGQYGRPPSYGPGGVQTPQQQMNGTAMAPEHFHEHKGPLTRLKDGIFNLISSEEDVIKMEMYTEYIGVCKYCFDPRTSPYDAPRKHHFHATRSRDSFEDLRRRRSIDKMRRRSREGLGAAGSVRVDKDSRYYSDRKKSSTSKTDLVAAGLATAGVAAGANALFNSDSKNFDDTYSIKSGHRESSAVRRRSRSSSRDRRRRSSYGVVGRDGRETREDYVTVRTKDGRTERRRVHRSRSGSGDRKSSMIGTAAGVAAGAALGASAMSAAGRSRHSRDHSPNSAYVRKGSRRSSSSSSGQSGNGIFGGFFSPSTAQKKRRGSKSKRSRNKKQSGGFFSFGNDSAASSDSDLAFGVSRTDLPLRRKSSMKNARKRNSDEHLAATVAGIGATAAALAAAQKAQKLGKRPSGVSLGAKRDVKYATPSGRPGQPVPVDDEWEDELPSDVDDASSVGSGLAFGHDDRKLSRRQSRESIGSQSSGAGGLGAWGWRWGGKDRKKKRSDNSPRPTQPPRPSGSGFGSTAGGMAAGAVAGAALDAYGRPVPSRTESMASSSTPQQPLQYVDPRPISDAGSMPGSRHASMPGSFDSSPALVRPGPGPIQHPKPVAPIQPAFTQRDHDFDAERPKPIRSQSSPVQSNFAQDAALIGVAAVGTAAVIASQRRKSKDVRFGFTEEQERRHQAESRKEQQRREEEERRRAEGERQLKREAERHTREQDVLRAREDENRRRAEAELERQRTAQREAEEQAEKYRQLEREKNEREELFRQEREQRERRERELTEEIERRRRELEEQKQRDIANQQQREHEPKPKERRNSERSQQEDAKSSTSSSVPWGAVVAGAAVAGVGAVAASEYERNKDQKRESRRQARAEDRDRYSAREVTPSGVDPSADSDSYNNDYYNSASRSRSPDHARHVEELARKAAGKVVSARAVLEDNEARYNDHQTQAEYFAPEELSHPAKGSKVKVVEPDADNAVVAYNAAATRAREQFDEEYAGLQSGKTKYAPYGVPKLGLVSPTPPPSAMKRASTPPASRVSRTQDAETGAAERPRKSSRSRSISWGVDQTHVYDVPTPEPHDERDSYIEKHDVPTTAAATAVGATATVAAGVALNEAVKGPTQPYATKEFVPSDAEDEEIESFSQPVTPNYQPSSRTDVSSTKEVPPVQGFVEGEVEERAPHIPGGFDDDEDIPSKPTASTTSRDASTSKPITEIVEPSTEPTTTKEADEPAWDPPLSKKDKKKREKAAKRGESFDSAPSFASLVDAATKAQEPVPEPQEDPPEEFLSKKEKKKREKGLKRGMSEDKTTPSEPAEEPSAPPTRDPEYEEPSWEPPLSKKEKKKREKEAKKQGGFADVAEAMMTTGGIATVASSMADSSNSPSAKWTPTVERDIRDIEPSMPSYTRTPPRESSGMPGGWDSDSKEKESDSPAEAIDPFQYQVRDEDWTPQSGTTQPSMQPADSTSSQTTKRESAKFNEPATSSPLKSEVVQSDARAEKAVGFAGPAPVTNGHASEGDRVQSSTAAFASTTPSAEEATNDQQKRSDYNFADRTVSPDDQYSVTSDPTGDRGSKRRSREEKSSQYYAEPDEYDDARSVAASEPADIYGSSRKSKRRSRHEDDDTASVTSSRSKRDREDSTSSKKAGFFGGLFGRKPLESVPKSDGAPLSRQSTKDSKDADAEAGERKERRRKHRSASEYGDDDDDTRSTTSESRSRRHRTRDDLDEYEDEKRDSARYEDENGSRHHRRRMTDEGDYSSGQRHHHRRRTDEDVNGQDQSFLGMRVEDTPPLPGNDEASLGLASDKQEQGDGDLVSTDRDTHLVSRDHATAFGLIDQDPSHDPTSETRNIQPDTHIISRDHANAFDLVDQEPGHHVGSETREIQPGYYPVSRDHADAFNLVDQDPSHRKAWEGNDMQGPGRGTSWDDDVEYLPALPHSRPESPTEAIRETDFAQPSPSDQRTTSQRVPVRFPFGAQPPTPGAHRTERSISFGGSLPSSPVTPMSGTKPRLGRPTSTEIRPLYLVERNRKTPVVEEILPSLPSSKTTSRASSMVGSDEYESAAEDLGSPERRRGLTVDTGHHYAERSDEDYLGSEQTTPRATEFPPDVLERPPRPEPQFYTWEDFARDERLRHVSEADQLNNKDLPELPPSRAESRADSDDSSSGAAGLADAAAVGSAAVFGYHALSRSDRRHDEDEVMRDATHEADENSSSPRLAPAFREVEDTESMPSMADPNEEYSHNSERSMDEEWAMEEVTSTVAVETDVAQPSPKPNELDRFFESEEQMEEGTSTGPAEAIVIPPSHKSNELDRFLDTEEQMEEGNAGTGPIDSQAMDVDQPRSVPTAGAVSTEHVTSEQEAVEEKDISMEDTVDDFMAAEDQMEAAEIRSADTEHYEHGKILASQPILEGSFSRDDDALVGVSEQADEKDTGASASTLPAAENEDEDDDQSASFAAPVLTRKQSKKAKKKGKSASKKKDEVAEPAVVQEEAVIDDDITAEASLPGEAGTDAPKTRSASSGSGARVSAILSDIIRRSSRGSDTRDTGMKSEAIIETSQNDATVQTSLETGDSSATRHLEANITSADGDEERAISQPQDEYNDASADRTRAAQELSEAPILQPEQEESWETSTSASRKQSKKNKKKQQRRQQTGFEQEPELQVQNDMPESNTLSDSREVNASTNTESAKDFSSTEIPSKSSAVGPMAEPTAFDDTLAAAAIALPLSDDREFDLDGIDSTTSTQQPAPSSMDTTGEDLERNIDDDVVQHMPGSFIENSTPIEGEEMEIDDAPAVPKPSSSEEVGTSLRDETTAPMQLDTEGWTRSVNTAESHAPMELVTEDHDQNSEQIVSGEVETATEPASAPSVAPATQEESLENPRDSRDQELEPTQEPEEEEFTWASSKKKGKKGKKGKQSAVATPAITEPKEVLTKAETTAFEEEPQMERESPAPLPTPNESMQADGISRDQEADPVQEPGEEEEEEFTWASSKKKGKKNKKGKTSAIATPPVTELQEVLSRSDTNVLDPQREPEPLTIDPTADVPQEQSREAEDPESFWDTPATKKKKGKKVKRSSITPAFVPTTSASLKIPQEPEQSSQDERESAPLAPNDDFDTAESALVYADSPNRGASITTEPVADDGFTKQAPEIEQLRSRDITMSEPSVEPAEPEAIVEPLTGQVEEAVPSEGHEVGDTASDEFSTADGEPLAKTSAEEQETGSTNPVEQAREPTFTESADPNIIAEDTSARDIHEPTKISPGADGSVDTATQISTEMEIDQNKSEIPTPDDTPRNPADEYNADVPAEEGPAEDAESLWAPFPSKKKGKKGKKGKTAEMNAVPNVQTTEETTSTDPMPEDVNDRSTTVPSSEFEYDAQAAQADEPMEFWSAKAKGKKGKQARISTPSVVQPFEEERAIATETASIPIDTQAVEETSTALTPENITESSTPLPLSSTEDNANIAQEDEPMEFWPAKPKGKKGKKSKKSASSAVEPFEEERAITAETPPILSEPSDPLTEGPIEHTALSNEPVEGPGPEEFWAAPVKGMKGKKSKKSMPSTVDPFEVDQAMAAETSSTPIEPSDQPADVSVDYTGMSNEPEAADPEDFWTAPAKGKKGKKSKRLASSIVEASEERSLASDTLDDTLESSTQLPEEARDQNGMISEPAEPMPEDFWATPAKGKKGKKGKKSKRQETFEEFDDAQRAINDQTDNMDIAEPFDNLEGTSKQVLSNPSDTVDTLGRDVEDVTAGTVSDPMSIDDMPPLPESPSLGAQEPERMETDDGHHEELPQFSMEQTLEPVTLIAAQETSMDRELGDDSRLEPHSAEVPEDNVLEVPATGNSALSEEMNIVHHEAETRAVPADADYPRGERDDTFVGTLSKDSGPSRTYEAASIPLPEDDFPGELQEPIKQAGRDISDAGSNAALGRTVPGESTNDDLDFAAHVARTLEDSGFDPNLVANDPSFQHRASPPGAVAEADPEEIFTPLKKRKGKKGKKAAEAPASDADAPQERVLESIQAQPTDDFSDTIEKTLAGTGFDTTLLQQATSTSNEVSSQEVDGDAEFTFSTSKRKKGKKSKKVQRDSEIVPEDLPQPESNDRGLGSGWDADQSNSMPSAIQLSDKEIDPSAAGYDDIHTLSSRTADNGAALDRPVTERDQDAPSYLSEPSEAFTGSEAVASSAKNVQIGEPTAHVAMGGGGEMDVDEMDRAYKAFKKNKRDKKKKKLTASQPDTPAETPMEEFSDPTESAVVPLNMESTAPVFIPATEQFRAVPSSDIGNQLDYAAELPPTEQPALGEQLTSSTSRVSARPEEHLHTSEISQPVPIAAERSPSSPSREVSRHESGLESVTGLAAFGTAAAAAITAGGIHSATERSADEQYELQDEHARASHTRDLGHTHSLKHAHSLGNARSLGLLPNDEVNGAHAPPSWSFASLEDEGRPLPESPLLGHKVHEIARDSGYQEMSSPSVRDSIDSGRRAMPEIRTTDSRESLSSRRSAEPLHISTGSGTDWDLHVPKGRAVEGAERDLEATHARTPSRESKNTPLESTTKNRASYLFQTTPETLKDVSTTPTSSEKRATLDYFPPNTSSKAFDNDRSGEGSSNQLYRDTFSPPPAGAMSPRGPLDTIPEEHHAHKRTVSQTDAKEPDNTKASRRSQTPQSIQSRERAMSPRSLPPMTIPAGARSVSDVLASGRSVDPTSGQDERSITGLDRNFGHGHLRQASNEQRSPSVMSNRSNKSAGQFRAAEEIRSYSRTSNRSSTPTLRRTSLSGDLRAASRRGDAGSGVGARSSPKTIPFEPPPTPPSNDDEVMDAGASRSVNMSDVYQGYGDAQASQVSPTRPPNMRKRQSMHIMELESRLDQLVAENQALQSTRATRGLADDGDAMQEDFNSRDLQLREKDNEINQMRTMLQPMQDEISRLTQINNGLTEANRSMVDEGNERYAILQQDHGETSRQLEDMRQEHGRLTSGVRAAIEAELATALADKNAEIQHLREELDVASEKIRALQVQVQSTKARDFLTVRDEDYFDGACQKLCQHVQQWVLRFSKVSDDRVCRLSTDIKDDKVEARLDNAILDGSDVDKLLSDRIKRRDVFMSVVMTMVWEFIFTRYLFGMDREQRQKLKALEKLLAEVGPPRAVAQWRATTLTLLAQRPQFAEQKNTDTEAVAAEIFGLLCMLLPPPSSANAQLMSSLQKVIGVAVDLSIEMRTQRAEYIMLPPLQPEYDTNGDLMRKVHFNASLMNERSGMFSSNEELEDSRAVVKIVLFPLVVKKGDEVGEGEEEIVVCPAQVLVHNDNARGKKIVRVQSGAMEIDDPRRSRQSLLSVQGSTAF